MSRSHNHCGNHEHFAHDRKVLWTVLALNFAMFILEIWQGLEADSTSLLADSMDFLSDSFSYAITLYVISRSIRTRAHASMLKASMMLILACGALAQGANNVLHEHTPEFITMGWVASLALIVNTASAMLLYRSRGRDSNMQSVWLCSRNDAIANVMIIVAAGLVFATGTLWPDLIVALGIAWLEGSAAVKIFRQARGELKAY